MCTAITYCTKDHYFGRNLDLDQSYQESVTVTPRNYPFHFRKMGVLEHHHALIGVALVINDYPLYYEATNEKGLSMAGLNFPGFATYYPEDPDKDNVSPFEFIPWILGQCETVAQARKLLERMNLVNIPFSDRIPLSPLHWIIADRDTAITVETLAEGMKIHDNPVGVLTNNPPFDYHMHHLTSYMNLSAEPVENQFSDRITLTPYSLGLGAMSLPGDLSSPSRFIKAAFIRLNSLSGTSESESVSQFFHILNSVAHPRGAVHVGPDRYEITHYSCCCNTDRGIYYYTTYENSQITGVDMHREDLEGSTPVSYRLITGQQIRMQN